MPVGCERGSAVAAGGGLSRAVLGGLLAQPGRELLASGVMSETDVILTPDQRVRVYIQGRPGGAWSYGLDVGRHGCGCLA